MANFVWITNKTKKNIEVGNANLFITLLVGRRQYDAFKVNANKIEIEELESKGKIAVDNPANPKPVTVEPFEPEPESLEEAVAETPEEPIEKPVIEKKHDYEPKKKFKGGKR